MTTYVQLIQTIFIALLVGSIYFQIGDDQGSIQDRVGALFFVMTNQAFSMIASLNLCEYFSPPPSLSLSPSPFLHSYILFLTSSPLSPSAPF